MASNSDFSFDPGMMIALIPTLMSVVGSVNIARLVKQCPSFKGSAKRILMGMSLCEVVSSVAFSAQSLFIPRETSHILWAIGNGSALGLMMQFSISSYIFSCFLSFIYLSKIRFGGGDNRDFCATRIEPWTGALGLCYPLITALIGAGMRVYSNMEFLPHTNTTENVEAVSLRQRELSARVGQFLFPGYPVTNFLLAVAVNGLVIFAFVRNGGNNKSNKNNNNRNDSLRSRTNGVATASVLLTYVWTAILRVFESNDISHFSKGGLLPLVLLQAFFLPALGLYNVLGTTTLQPRWRRVRTLYPCESNVWCAGRALFGGGGGGTKFFQPTTGVVVPTTTTSTTAAARVEDHDFNFSSRRRCRF